MPPITAEQPSTVSPRKKGTLFCQSCWHESPVDGDWRVQASTDGTRLRCPDCGATVTDRGGETGDLPVVGPSPSSDTRVSLVARFVRLSLVWSVWPCTLPDDAADSRRQPCHP